MPWINISMGIWEWQALSQVAEEGRKKGSKLRTTEMNGVAKRVDTSIKPRHQQSIE